MARDIAATLGALILLVACATATVTPTLKPQAPPRPSNTPRPTVDVGVLARQPLAEPPPLLKSYRSRMQQALSQPIPLLMLADEMSSEQLAAQQIAARDPRVQNELRAKDGSPLRTEVFGVYAVRASEIVSATSACRDAKCYRVEMYSYAYNMAIIAIVNVNTNSVLTFAKLVDMQPDIPPELGRVATQIAINSPEVIEALGIKPDETAAVMASTKTGLTQSRCERSKHLCVAPTFVVGGRALWAIVDLTEGALVGARWSQTGSVNPPSVSEKRLQNDVVSQRYCETINKISRGDWKFDYAITSSDGLEITNVRFKDAPIFDSIKVVDWHVSYSAQDKFGYSDAVGCPTFSQAVVVAFNGSTIVDIVANGQIVGFAIEQNFRSELWPLPCNYYYRNRYEFYVDGRLRPAMINLGRGCGNTGTYRPILRMAFAPASADFAKWSGTDWSAWTREQWSAPFDALSSQGYQYRLTDASGSGFFIQPQRGQHPDNPFVYATLRKPEEGDANLISLGNCCNTDYRQGPEQFIEPAPETIARKQIVVWYVPQIANDDRKGSEYCWADTVLINGVYEPRTFPCESGPMLVPTP